jgi:uncharacterized protein (DUF58 family)
MPTRRGWAALLAGLGLWLVSRLIGSPDLHMIAVGVAALPLFAAVFVRWSRVRLEVHRHLSTVRAFPGARVTVTFDVENQARLTTPFLLLEDMLPSSFGKPARLVVTGIPPRNDQTVSYSVVCRQRGRYTIGPLAIYVGDPFGLARIRIETSSQGELVVYPKVEDIEANALASQGAGAGESAVRHLYRTAAEFYTMREYVTGDDLRRIHWPSVAKTGQLMIRQDESTRRSTALLLFDNRAATLGAYGSPGFERAVSAAATVGRALIRAGFGMHYRTVDSRMAQLTEEHLLESLAAVSPTRKSGLGEALGSLRAGSLTDSTLVVVSAPLSGSEVSSLTRVGTGFGRKLIVMVYPQVRSALPPDAATELEGRATTAQGSLQRAGWSVFLLHPDGRLADTWQQRRTGKLHPAALSS